MEDPNEPCFFLRLPPEIRLMIYPYLVQYRPDESSIPPATEKPSNPVLHFKSMSSVKFERWRRQGVGGRTAYEIPDLLHPDLLHPDLLHPDLVHPDEIWNETQRKILGYPTTYYCAEPFPSDREKLLHTAIMSTNRQICEESLPVLYGHHCFHFRDNYTAAAAFLQDRSRYSTPFLREVGFQRHLLPADPRYYLKVGRHRHKYCSITPVYSRERESWKHLCQIMAHSCHVKKIRFHLVGEQHVYEWRQLLTDSDLRLLMDIRHSRITWIEELSLVTGVEELVVTDSIFYSHGDCPRPDLSMRLYWFRLESHILAAAMCGSMKTSLPALLRKELGITSGRDT